MIEVEGVGVVEVSVEVVVYPAEAEIRPLVPNHQGRGLALQEKYVLRVAKLKKQDSQTIVSI